MNNLIPHFIQTQEQQGLRYGRFEAHTLFVDLSGFTALTESLMQQGTPGAEQLSVILNEIFEPLVHLVYVRGGIIPYFAGDAFTAIFPIREGRSAADVMYTALEARELFLNRESRFGEFTIGIKIGISAGTVEWGIVGQAHKGYYFRGSAIDGCADSQGRASGQEIVLDRRLCDLLPAGLFDIEAMGDGYYKVSRALLPERSQPPGRALGPISTQEARKFLPAAIVDYLKQGEFRTVISIFISFKGVETHEELDVFASVVLQQVEDFSGYFKEIDFGDKGGVMVIFFGAPVSFENNIDRALEFIMALQDAYLGVKGDLADLTFRAGITVGTAYTGIVGGTERCQYACVGNRVNLSARLMTFAEWGEVLADEEIQKNPHFKFMHYGDVKYKGISGSVPTFKLLGRDFENEPEFIGQFIDRDSELEQLAHFSNPIWEARSAGAAYIFGEAGIGKSRLTYELRRILQEASAINWHICQADQILRKPFNPFIYFLRNFFSQSSNNSDEQNQQNFIAKFAYTVSLLQGLGSDQAAPILRELQRTRPILATLVGLSHVNSLWDQLDARGRYQNTITSIINLLLAESLLHPTVVELEDAHWLDENSLELLQEFARRMAQYPILLIITSRYQDDGDKAFVLDRAATEALGLPFLEVNLNVLQPAAVRTFAEVMLDGKITEDFFELLLRATNSNPFYLEQVLKYFMESDVLGQQDGLWYIKDANVKLSNSINAILMARIDRLSELVRETVKAAAVIGREFEIPVLSEVMKTQEEFIRQNGNTSTLLREQVQTAERGQIWQAMDELRYIFRHALLREAVYDMQLRTRLQSLHELIARAIERLYHERIEEHYFDLAFHYEQAGVFDKTCEYLHKAADYARNNYQNQLALDYYERLLKKIGQEKDFAGEIETYLKKGRVQELIGNWDGGQASFDKALQLAKKSRDVLLIGKANNSLGRLLMLKGEYTEAMHYLQVAASLFESVDDKSGIARAYGNIGNLYFRQGKYDEARSYFEQSINIGDHENSLAGTAQIVSNLGLTLMNHGLYDEGVKVQEEQLLRSAAAGDKLGMATLHINTGIVYFEKGDYDSALANYEKGLDISEELGNKLLTSIATGCIGSVYERRGDYVAAMDFFEQDLRLCEELGDKQGIAIALGLIGELYSIRGVFDKAITYLQKNLMLCEELGYQKGIAKAVNTLGDVFFYTHQHERSIAFYTRAIELARKINNRLVLCGSLVEKGIVEVALGRLEDLQETLAEALELARALGNADLLFDARLLEVRHLSLTGRSEQAEEILNGMLHEAIDTAAMAAVCYELALLHPREGDYVARAQTLYELLYQTTPKFSYKVKMDKLALLKEAEG